MVRKKIDNRIRVLIENNIHLKMRSFFVIVGKRAKEQVAVIHHLMSKAVVRSRPTVLWCYKKELGFSSNRKKRMRELQSKIRAGTLDAREDDPLEMFVSTTDIRYCFYNETNKILGNTYGMLILQDFEAITPNLLARTIETVEGGGAVIMLLDEMDSLQQFFTMSMDVHQRYRSERYTDIVARFNERFILSLASCPSCLVLDDEFNVLPISAANANIEPIEKSQDKTLSEKDEELSDLKTSLQDTHPIGDLVNLCRTLDQSHAVLKFVEAISEKTLRSTVSLTAARGRGKSAALGLSVSAAVAFGYSNIFITSPSPENLTTLFEFIFKGLDALKYQEHVDYDVVQSTNQEFNKAVIRVNIHRDHRQTIQYIHPTDAVKLGQAELVVIDEAAAIPLPLVKALLGPYLVFMASTINGYEGTGRSLSLKLLQQLRTQSASHGSINEGNKQNISGRSLNEITLNESIRYAEGDHVEAWLNQLLCLDATNISRITSGCPSPENCELFYVNRDTLFSFHKAAEEFLQRIMSLYVSSHYKNTPNDLQMLSDSPSHHIFVLLPPVSPESSKLPEVLVVLQVSFEGEISKASILDSIHRGKRASGDLIPWTLTQQFQDDRFAQLSGARVVRIATHPDYQGMGYGQQALKTLQSYFEGKIMNLDEKRVTKTNTKEQDAEETSIGLLHEKLTPRKGLPPLLSKLSERKAEQLDYLGVSYGLTGDLLRFWKKAGYLPVYLRQTQNALTGENSCIMLKALNEDEQDTTWLYSYNDDFRRRFMSLLSYQFRTYRAEVALSLLQKSKSPNPNSSTLTMAEIYTYFIKYDLKRLEMYANKLADNHLIMDLLPHIARLYFSQKFPDLKLTIVQKLILLSLGLQHRQVEELEKEVDLPSSQLLGLFNKMMRKFSTALNDTITNELSRGSSTESGLPVEEQQIHTAEEDASKDKSASAKSKLNANDDGLSLFEIKGSEDDWKAVLSSGKSQGIVSIKGQASENKRKVVIPEEDPSQVKKKKRKVKCPKN